MPNHPKMPNEIPERERTAPRREPPQKDPPDRGPKEPLEDPDDEPSPPA